MTRLSQKQQANVERMWALEALENENLIAMADALEQLAKERRRIKAEIDAIGAAVPLSMEDTWQRIIDKHPTFESVDDRERWRRAYDSLKRILS